MDGAPGLVKAVKRVWPRAYRQRCQVHKMRNILAKLPRLMQAKIKGLMRQIFLVPTYEAALKRGRDHIAKFKDRHPAAMDCLERDLEECVTYLRFPEAHHQRIRTTNRLERLNGESRRRTKVIPRFPTERSCLSFLSASLITASKHWRGSGLRGTTHAHARQGTEPTGGHMGTAAYRSLRHDRRDAVCCWSNWYRAGMEDRA
jgi:transposase-like protein